MRNSHSTTPPADRWDWSPVSLYIDLIIFDFADVHIDHCATDTTDFLHQS